jgi:tRNA-2-methylthio-N6-dimethylallyladenosine synthase
MKYYIITYGCQMNKSDSERIATVLESRGYEPTSKINEADLIVVNMCSVRQSAVDRVYGLIPKFTKLKTQNLKLKTILTGCILKEDKRKFEKSFDQVLKFKDLLKYQPKYQDKSVAFVPISNGCNNACVYCVVPFTRGPLVCRDHREILKEVKNAAQKDLNPIRNAISNGAREIWLLGQNVNDYTSPSDAAINFAKLLKMVNDISGNFKFFFISPHPKNFSEELIDTLAKSEKFGRYINLPIQSGDNKILKKMNRNYTMKEYKNLVKNIRKKIPEIRLSTDVIVGFPGETKKQFQNTVKLFKEIKFNWAYIAKYSPRPGTVAFKMKNDVPLKEKKRREKTLREILMKKVEE